MENEKYSSSRLDLPNAVILSVLTGKTEEIEGIVKTIEGGALFGVPDQEKWWGVLNHSLLVRRVAIGLTDLLNNAREKDDNWQQIDRVLAGNAGLLEDFAKRYEKQEETGVTDHTKAGLLILQNEQIQFPGKEKIMRVLITHLYGMNGYNEAPHDWMEKVLILADHYATGEIVSLEERFADFKKRQSAGSTMPTEDEEFWRIHDYCYQIEKELMDEVGLREEDLIDYLKNLVLSKEELKLRTILRRPPEAAPKTLRAVSRLQQMQKIKVK